MKKLLALILAAVMLLTLVPAMADDAVEITMLLEGNTVTDDAAVLEKLNAYLAEKIGVTLKPTWGTWGDFDQTAQNAAGSNHQPHIKIPPRSSTCYNAPNDPAHTNQNHCNNTECHKNSSLTNKKSEYSQHRHVIYRTAPQSFTYKNTASFPGMGSFSKRGSYLSIIPAAGNPV